MLNNAEPMYSYSMVEQKVSHLGRLPDKGKGEDTGWVEQGDIQQGGAAARVAALQQGLS